MIDRENFRINVAAYRDILLNTEENTFLIKNKMINMPFERKIFYIPNFEYETN